MAEEADDALDGVLQAIEFGERRIDADGPVQEQPAQPRISRGVDHLGLADRPHHAFCRTCIALRVVAAGLQEFCQAHLDFARAVAQAGVKRENVVRSIHNEPLKPDGGGSAKPGPDASNPGLHILVGRADFTPPQTG